MNLSCAIFGSGLSGQAASSLARDRGHAVTVFDESGRGNSDTFGAADLAHFDRFIFSPGFAASHPWRLLLQASGKPVQSELSFAAEHWQGPIIGVTGTNGKSTLTRLLVEALRRTGQKTVAAGNIGRPLSEVVMDCDNQKSTCAVCEISSFQAELAWVLKLDGLLWTNFAEDHLDRYANMTDYYRAKAGLFKCLQPGAVCVIGPQVKQWADELQQPCDHAPVTDAEEQLLQRLQPESPFSRQPQRENFVLAAQYCRLANLCEDALVAAANDFVLDSHRLELVSEQGGVTFWDDSKATNFHAALAAMKSLPRPIIWIGGGRPKGGDVDSFAQKATGLIDAAVLYGEAAPQLEKAFSKRLEQVQTIRCFEQAVRAAAKLGSTCSSAHVLLSPGFSSFDQFESYAARGKTFNSIVLSL